MNFRQPDTPAEPLTMTKAIAAEVHLHCVLNGIEAAMRGESVAIMLDAAHHNALCCMDVIRRAIADADRAEDFRATRKLIA